MDVIVVEENINDNTPIKNDTLIKNDKDTNNIKSFSGLNIYEEILKIKMNYIDSSSVFTY